MVLGQSHPQAWGRGLCPGPLMGQSEGEDPLHTGTRGRVYTAFIPLPFETTLWTGKLEFPAWS